MLSTYLRFALVLCLAYLGCEKSFEKRADDCGEETIKRLGLTAEPPPLESLLLPCYQSYHLYELDGELYVLSQIVGPTCNGISAASTCSGELFCTLLRSDTTGCYERWKEDARELRLLGYSD